MHTSWPLSLLPVRVQFVSLHFLDLRTEVLSAYTSPSNQHTTCHQVVLRRDSGVNRRGKGCLLSSLPLASCPGRWIWRPG